MLYVKLRKKSESFPVLILVGIFLLYMNAGDLFKSSFRLYTIACVNRRVLAHQFICGSLVGVVSHGYANVFVLVTLVAATIGRSGWQLGKSGIPIVGSFLITPLRRTVVMLGLAAQCFGFFTGTVLGIAMLDQSIHVHPLLAINRIGNYTPALSFGFLLLSTRFLHSFVSKPNLGRVQTLLASGLIASVSRCIPLYSSPLLMVPVLMVTRQIAPGAVTGITEFIPQLVAFEASKLHKLRIFVSVLLWHAAGALLAAYYSVENVFDMPEYVSPRAIGQELFFGTMLSFVASRRPELSSLVYLSGWLGTTGTDTVHLSSSISLGAEFYSNGRLAARLIWQSIGGLIGAGVLGPLADSDRIDFDPITSVTRTTDGRVLGK